jgi:L-threonylcarbamoyladenylate synthase
VTIPLALEDVGKAVATLRSGGVIAMPSDTLYALCAVASDDEAVRRVFAIKGREVDKALLLFVSDLAVAQEIGVFDESAVRLARRFWPGPLTIVVPRVDGFDSLALAGGDTLGLRVPDHAIALAVLHELGAPCTATSANLSGGLDPVSAQEVRSQIGEAIDLIIDGGDCPVGVASTIVDCTDGEPRVLRQGVVTEASIREALRD